MKKQYLFTLLALALFAGQASTASADAKVKHKPVKEKSNTEKFAAEYDKRVAREGTHRDQDCSCRGSAYCSCSPTQGTGYGYGYGYGYGWGGGMGPGWSRSGWGGSDIPTTGYSAPVRR